MNWLLFILFIGACHIYDNTAVQTSDVTKPKTVPKTEEKPEEDLLKLWQEPDLYEECQIEIFKVTFTLPNKLPYKRPNFFFFLLGSTESEKIKSTIKRKQGSN
ncbi:hypothetical protein Ddc_17016 [Ditylenchus destructor]|nr:hypothetical protein Ddc_17016 [Ditylenchus destructor]